MTRVPAPDPLPPRDHLPPVRVAPEEFNDADQMPPAVVHSNGATTDVPAIRSLGVGMPRYIVEPELKLYTERCVRLNCFGKNWSISSSENVISSHFFNAIVACA